MIKRMGMTWRIEDTITTVTSKGERRINGDRRDTGMRVDENHRPENKKKYADEGSAREYTSREYTDGRRRKETVKERK